MKIGIDARFVGPGGTGLGKYAEKLIENLARIDRKNEYCIFLRQDNWDFLKLPQNFTKVPADIPWYSLAEQTKLAGKFMRQNLDLLHIPHFNVPLFYRRKFIITVHDLIHHQFSQESTTTRSPLIFKIKRAGYKLVINSAVKRAQKIIVPSNYVKDQVERTFKVSPNKITVTYEAAEEEYFGKTKNQLRQRSEASEELRTKDSLVYVGNAYPHKNLGKLLDALKILTSPHPAGDPTSFHPRGGVKVTLREHPGGEVNWNLLIVSPRDVFTQRLHDEIKKRHLEDNVKLTGYLEAKELVKLFCQAKAYVFPSLAEGFGIPGLNAMAAGLPVACANIPTLEEVYGDAALYFDPHDQQDIAQKIRQIVTSEETRLDLIKRGQAQAAKYSWRRMAEQTLDVYKSA